MRSLFGAGTPAVAVAPRTAGAISEQVSGTKTTASGTSSVSGSATMMASDPVTTLQQALVAEGMSPNCVKMQYQEQTVLYPGGSYQSHQIQCDFGGGRISYIDADVMKINPEIAALDIKWIQAHPKIGV